MSRSHSLMKHSLVSLSFLSATLLSTHTLAETHQLNKVYQEPTRGFFIEHGTVAGTGKASVELHTGSDEISSGGGIRLGVGNGEVIFNSGFNNYDTNEILVKWGLPRQNKDGSKQTPLTWAVLGGIAHTDIEFDDNTDYQTTSLKLGLAMTVKADAGVFTATPKLIYADNDVDSDTFVELDLGAYVGLIENSAGLFSAGVEGQFTTEDDVDNTIALGLRWSYNNKINLDIVPIVMSNDDLMGIPGLVRLNVSF